MELPTEFTEPKSSSKIENFGMILFGPPKVGKTTFASEWPDNLMVECEPNGADWVRCKKVEVNSMAELREVYGLIRKDKSFKTVTIDSLDKVASWIEGEICAEMGLKNILDNKKGEKIGNQWGEYQERIMALVLGTLKIDRNILFLAHTKKAETDGNGTVINPKSINLYGSTATKVLAMINNIGYMYAREVPGGETKRFLSFKSGDSVEIGSRHPALRDKIIELPLGGAYKAFERCFTDKPAEVKKPQIKDPAKEAPKPAAATK